MPTDVRWGDWREVRQLFPTRNQRILIASSLSSLSRIEELERDVLRQHYVERLSIIQADPLMEMVQKATFQVMKTAPDWIIAMGGGSVLDTAKAAAVAATNGGNVKNLLRGSSQIASRGIPLIAIPTTSGSGSEVTPYASITDTEQYKKISLTHDYLFPKYALLDPSLTVSLSDRQTAISGMDALCHAIEGYWSNRATPATDSLAINAARLLMRQLPITKRAPLDLVARRRTMEGSMLAGMTISNARTTAVHAISYPITVSYGVPHGLACSLILPSMVRFNSNSMDSERERRLLENLEAESMGHLSELVEQLQSRLDLPVKLSDVGIGINDISNIVENGYRPDRMNNNPRRINSEELTQMLMNII